ncbi:MAG TPA: peptidoglycan-binding protein [Candidatus Paceibacterota bacterium]|nr:peptidoglycan-binding protein [Candidatus Paceibacterota bacterium]
MKTVTTRAIAKVAAVATGLAMATSMLSLAPMAHAASLTSAQIQSILSLLSSFGADSATIANVNSALTGQTTTTTTTSSGSGSCSVGTSDLTMGSTGAAVTSLQQALIGGGYSIPAGATGYFGAQTRAAVIAWQKAMGVSPAAGYFGAISRSKFNLSCTGSTSTTTTTTTSSSAGTGTGLKVSLSPTSPNGTVLVATQGIGDLGDFVFANPTSAPINVTGLTFNRTGVSNDATLANVYLYNAGTRITDSAGVNNGQFSYSDSAGLFTVPAGGTYTVSVRSDIASGSSGQQIGVSLVSVTSSGTLDSSVSFPIASGYQTISSATLATVSYGATVTPSAPTTISPQNDYPVWQNTVSVSTNPVKLSSMRFTNLGSIDSANLINLRLYVDGVQAGAAVPVMGADRTVTFDLSAAPVALSTQSHVIKVLANITGGASRTIVFSVQRSSDSMFVDSQLNQPVTPTDNGDTTFSAQSTGTITMQAVSGTSGVSVSLDPSSPTSNIAVGASSAEWASFDMLASGENVKVSDLYVYASSTTSGGALAGVGGLNNGKIYVNGVQVGSTKDIGSLVANKTDFSLGSSLILPAGVNTIVSVYGDAQDTGGTNLPTGSTVIVSLAAGSNNAQGQSSLVSTDVPAAATSGNSITVSSSSLTATKYSGYGNQTVIAGQNNMKLGAFTLSSGSTEGVTVNSIAITFPAAVSSTITNLTLKDDATGNVLGSVQTTPSTSNSFAVNFDVPVSSTKTIDIYGNVLSGANLGTITASVDAATTGTGDLTGISTSPAITALQTITIGSGTLAVTRGAGDPVSNIVLAGASSVLVGQFNFAASNSAYTVQNLAVLVPNSAATSVTNVTVSYQDINGVTQTVSAPLAVTAANAYATATFTGLTMYVPMNSSANLNVSVGTPTIASGATSGAAINVSIDGGGASGANSDFKAINGAGSTLTNVNSTGSGTTGPMLASNGTFYVHKSIPTFAMLSTGVTVPSTGNPLYRFSISADPAGAIQWTHLVFNIATTSATVTNVYLTDDSSGTNLLDNTTSSASTTATTITVDLTKNSTQSTYAQVAAGATKTYDLYGTVAGFTTGSTITISLASDGSHAAEGSAATTAGLPSNVVWSGMSATGHSISTTDWTNGYLLKNFTTNATSYSK